MGTAAFQWKGLEFLFLMNRDKSDFLEAETVKLTRNARGKQLKLAPDRRGKSFVAEVDAKFAVVRGGNEMWGGSWFGYKKGRFAFVLDSSDSEYSTTLVPRFLESTMHPLKFAADLADTEAASFGMKLHLVIADINHHSQSIYHISKRSDKIVWIDNVLHGFHTISESGFDSSLNKY